MTNIYKNLSLCLEQIRQKTEFVPETALVLGLSLIHI